MHYSFTLVKCLVILPLVVLAGASFAQAPIKFEHLTVKDGLSDNRIWSMLQDRKGYLWFGTLDGLSKYDGYSVITYKYRPHDSTSISHNIIFKIWEDAQGLIWTGTAESGLCKFDPATEQFTTYRPPPPIDQADPALRAVSAINEDQEGRIWVGTYGGELRRFDKKTGLFSQKYGLNYEPSVDESARGIDAIFTIYKDRTKALWFGNKAGVHKLLLTPGPAGAPAQCHFKQYHHDPSSSNSLSGNVILSIYEDKKGLFWIGSEQRGLNRFDPKTGVFTHYRHNPKNPHSLSSDSLFEESVVEDAQETIWIGTHNGLNRLNDDQTTFTRYQHDPTDATSLGSNVVSKILMDRAGSLWVGTLNGVSRIDPHPLPFRSATASLAPLNALRGSVVSALYEDKTGTLWIVTETGLASFHQKSGLFTRYKSRPDFQINWRGCSVLEDRSATFWIGSGHKLLRFDRKAGQFLTSASQRLSKLLANDLVLALYEDCKGLLWIGCQHITRSYDATTGLIQEYRHDPANLNTLADHQVNAIQEDNRGNLWFGHGSNGISKLNRKTGTITRFQHRVNDTTSFSSNTVLCIYRDTKGILWFGTSAGGLCRLNEQSQTFTTFTDQQGLASNTISAILEDNQGNLWLSTNGGLAQFCPTTHKFTNYDAQDGLQSNQLTHAAVKGRDGTVYIGSDNGLNAFKPHEITPNRYVPPVVITRFRLFDTVVPGKQEATQIELTYRQNFISFEYAALNYTNPQKNQYRYKLEGVDADWVQAGTRRMANYTDLDPGEYVFRVKGSNNNGVWNEQGTTMHIIIHLPWWRTGWFICLVLSVVTCLVYGGLRYRVKQIRWQEAKRVEAEQQKADLSRKLSEMKMQALRAQMNPHFIFNSLNSINTFILKNDPDAASDYLAKFSRLIRLILQNSNSATITLQNELDALELYLKLEALRFRQKFNFHIDVDPDVEAEDIIIPSLLIQPYVENAIWHGLLHKESLGHLRINLYLENQQLVCVIEDNGIGRQRAAELKSKSAIRSKPLGMQITASRMELMNELYGKQTTVTIVDLVDAAGQARGTRVILMLSL
ncbi:two-component regulator propeller domain-containing protein [Spirosoma pulveris]